MCGEQTVGSARRGRSAGPSPRVRGTGRHQRGARRPRRSIPACAGNSSRPASSRMRISVHPRVCGEQGIPQVEPVFLCGPSPRVRGTDSVQREPLYRGRSIPACAGNRYGCSRRSLPTRSIPACAGNSGAGADRPLPLHGPSPRVRGTVLILNYRQICNSVHPRVCGEQGFRESGLGSYCTVHPRVCGEQQRPCASRSGAGRSIPACAGNSCGLHGMINSIAVHPRVCGEQQRRQRRCGRGDRSIPACAGNRGGVIATTTIAAVHPRVCGEQ